MAEAIGPAVHIQTDTIRFMIPRPAYTGEESKFVYQAMFLVGRQALKTGYDAILDGTFLREDYRAEAEKKLARCYSAWVVVCVLCDQEVARKRNSKRDATVPEESFNRLCASFERPKKAIFVQSDRRPAESAAAFVVRKLSKIGGREKTPSASSPNRLA